ncbi:DUF2515 family protein [Vogesella indigofera]|uniref:DUF2515 family protein n=1 Tax=Vogesella indigofera TaxID=45465 RepID=UPI003CCC6492
MSATPTWLESWFSPDLELAFTHACQTDDPKLKSAAPEETIFENYKSRMDWIIQAVQQFHNLMQTRAGFMESERLCCINPKQDDFSLSPNRFTPPLPCTDGPAC